MWLAAFVIVTLALLLAPLLPSLRELIFATDAAPLRVIQAYDTEITHFATEFTVWLRTHFREFFATADPFPGEVIAGALPDKTRFQMIGNGAAPSFTDKEMASATTRTLLISHTALRLPERMFFESEIYSARAIHTSEKSQFRALLAQGDLALANDCTVLRWAHSSGSLYAAEGCSLFGRASAANEMTLGQGCVFERLHARMIVFDAAPVIDAASAAPEIEPLAVLATLPRIKDRYARRWLIDGTIDIPAQHAFDGDLVASNAMHIGAGAHITGSLKSTGDMVLAEGSRIDGAVVSGGNIHVGPRCVIAGPLIAEDTITIEEHAVIGGEAQPTTITAPRIRIACGVTAYGTVWADENAMVLPMGVRV